MVLLSSLGWAMLKAVIFLGATLTLGFWGIPWLMNKVALVGSRELFVLTVLSLSLGAAFGSNYFGLSLALGAFLAGLMVSESEYAHQALADIVPLRDIFATLFFVSLGMFIDPRFVAENVGLIVAVVAAIMFGKFVIASLIPRTFGYSLKTALFVGSGLSQIGEFSFILALLALDLGIISSGLFELTIATAGVSMLLTPLAMNLTSKMYYRLSQRQNLSALLAKHRPEEAPREDKRLSGHVVVCGYGRTGQNLVQVLQRRGFAYIVIDIDPRVIDLAHATGIPHIYGDASKLGILVQAEVDRAKVMVIAFPDPIASRLTVQNALRLNSKLDIVARVHLDDEIADLRELGVAETVRPEFEAGLEIIRHTLHRFGLTTQEIQYIINSLREEGL
jgi:CPA2 family monovalent cation:H+ antiporter-2